MAVYRVVTSALLYGQTCQNVWHMADGGTYTTASATALTVEIRDGWIPSIRSRLNQAHVWNMIQVYNALSSSTPPVNLAVSIAGQDTGSSTQMIPFSAYILRFKTALAGPAGRGRIYLPGVTVNQLSNGLLNAATITAWNGVLATLGGRYIGAGSTTAYRIAVASRSNPAGWKEVTNLEVPSYMGCQRRRNIGVGI